MKNIILKLTNYVKLLVLILFFSILFDLAFNFILAEKFKKKIGISLNYSLFSEKYHHEIAPNIAVNEFWGNKNIKIYTDKNSLRILKNQKVFYETSENNIAFVGDSFVWGSGINYEDHFINQLNSNYNFLNLGYISYSPSIYYKKIENLLVDKNITIKNLFLFLDTTDVWDEGLAYREDINGNIVNNFKTNEENKKKIKKYLFKNYLKQNSFLYKFYEIYFRSIFRRSDDVKKCLNDKEDNFSKYLSWERLSYSYDRDLLNSPWVKKGKRKSIYYLDKIAKISKEKNVKLTLVLYPSAIEILKQIPENESLHMSFFRNWAKNNSIDYLNFYKILNKHPSGLKNYKEFFILCDIHWNENAHKVIRSAINTHLANSKF